MCSTRRRSASPAAQVCSKDGVPNKSGDEALPGLYFCGFQDAFAGYAVE